MSTGARQPTAGRSTGRPELAGHYKADRALRAGLDFGGLALKQEQEVLAELAEGGIEALMLRDAQRLQVVSDLYYHALLKRVGEGTSLVDLDRMLARMSSLTTQSLKGWQAVRELRQKAGLDLSDYEVVLLREGQKGNGGE